MFSYLPTKSTKDLSTSMMMKGTKHPLLKGSVTLVSLPSLPPCVTELSLSMVSVKPMP